jgi:hypothetical protein
MEGQVSRFMVGRQPIFDAKLAVHGYELLFRGPGSPRPDGDAMTADILVRAGLDIGLEALVGSKLAFVNVTRSFLVGQHEVPFSPQGALLGHAGVLGAVLADVIAWELGGGGVPVALWDCRRGPRAVLPVSARVGHRSLWSARFDQVRLRR